ncbi:MAG: hypothetical protein ACNS63_03565 [Candidatus Nitrospinota bacterium M3_3B_026]
MNGDSSTDKSASQPPGLEVVRVDFSDPRDPALEGWKVVPEERPSGEEEPGSASTKSLPGLPETEAVYFPDEVYGSVEAAYTAAVLWSRRYQEEPDWSDTTNISRVDTGPEQGDTHGDFVRVQRQGTLRKKFFSDAHFGGKTGARHAALIWRDLIKGQMPEALSPEAARQKSAARQSQFDVPGMTVIKRTDAEGFVHPALQVRWTTPEGQVRRHILSLQKWSPRQGVWKAAKRVVEEYEAGKVDVRRSYLFSALPERWFEEATTTERVQQLYDRAVAGTTEEAEKILRDRDEALEGVPGLSLATRKRNGRYVPLLRITYENEDGMQKTRSRALGRRSLASATRELCSELAQEWEEASPEEATRASKARPSPFSVFRKGLSAEEQVGHLTELALPSLRKKMRELLSGPPGVSLYFQRLASGRYSPMVEVTWEAPSGDLRRGVSSALEHTLRGALLRSCEKAARALASGEVRQKTFLETPSPFSNLTGTDREALRLGSGVDAAKPGALSEASLFELVARLYRSVLPSIETAYYLHVLHGAPGLRFEEAPHQEGGAARLVGQWPQEDSSWATCAASLSELGLDRALRDVLRALAEEVSRGTISVRDALTENSPLRALEVSEERLGRLAGEDLQEMLFDKLYPPLCAIQRIENGPKERREDRFVGSHLSIKSGSDARKALQRAH